MAAPSPHPIQDTSVGLTNLFHAKIDMVDVGWWSELSGLKAKYEIEEYKEGGNNFFTHKFPGRLEYDNIELKRPFDRDQSAKLWGWFASLMGQSAVRSTATVIAYDYELGVVATWSFIDVVPVKWKGPDFNAEGAKVAMEQLEFAHHGFTRT